MRAKIETQLHELLNIVIRINETPFYSAYFDYAGHVNSIDIRVTAKNEYEEMLYSKSCYINSIGSDVVIEGICNHPSKMIKELTKFLLKVPEFNG